MQELVALGCFIVFSTLFALAAVITGFIVAPRTKNCVKTTTYECGIVPFSDARVQYNAHFFMYAILFLLFDIETIMLFPFAVAYGQLGMLAFFEAGVFVLILLLGLYYAINKKILKWR